MTIGQQQHGNASVALGDRARWPEKDDDDEEGEGGTKDGGGGTNLQQLQWFLCIEPDQ